MDPVDRVESGSRGSSSELKSMFQCVAERVAHRSAFIYLDSSSRRLSMHIG